MAINVVLVEPEIPKTQEILQEPVRRWG